MCPFGERPADRSATMRSFRRSARSGPGQTALRGHPPKSPALYTWRSPCPAHRFTSRPYVRRRQHKSRLMTTGGRPLGETDPASNGRDFPVKLQRYVAVAGAGLIATATLAACGSNNNGPTTSSSSAGGGASSSASASGGISCGSGTLTLAGSSAQKNAIDKFTKDYQTACSGATINYNPSGSGA